MSIVRARFAWLLATVSATEYFPGARALTRTDFPVEKPANDSDDSTFAPGRALPVTKSGRSPQILVCLAQTGIEKGSGNYT